MLEVRPATKNLEVSFEEQSIISRFFLSIMKVISCFTFTSFSLLKYKGSDMFLGTDSYNLPTVKAGLLLQNGYG